LCPEGEVNSGSRASKTLTGNVKESLEDIEELLRKARGKADIGKDAKFSAKEETSRKERMGALREVQRVRGFEATQ